MLTGQRALQTLIFRVPCNFKIPAKLLFIVGKFVRHVSKTAILKQLSSKNTIKQLSEVVLGWATTCNLEERIYIRRYLFIENYILDSYENILNSGSVIQNFRFGRRLVIDWLNPPALTWTISSDDRVTCCKSYQKQPHVFKTATLQKS